MKHADAELAWKCAAADQKFASKNRFHMAAEKSYIAITK